MDHYFMIAIGCVSMWVIMRMIFGRHTFKFALGLCSLLLVTSTGRAETSIVMGANWSPNTAISGTSSSGAPGFYALVLTGHSSGSPLFAVGGSEAVARDVTYFSGEEPYYQGTLPLGLLGVASGSGAPLLEPVVLATMRYYPESHTVTLTYGAYEWTSHHTSTVHASNNRHRMQFASSSTGTSAPAFAVLNPFSNASGYFFVYPPVNTTGTASTQPAEVEVTVEIEPEGHAPGEDLEDVPPQHGQHVREFLEGRYVEGSGDQPGLFALVRHADANGATLDDLADIFTERLGIPIMTALPEASATKTAAHADIGTFIGHFSNALWVPADGAGSGDLVGADMFTGVIAEAGGLSMIVYDIMTQFEHYYGQLGSIAVIIRASVTVLLVFNCVDWIIGAFCWGLKVDRPQWMGIPWLFRLPFELLGGASIDNGTVPPHAGVMFTRDGTFSALSGARVHRHGQSSQSYNNLS